MDRSKLTWWTARCCDDAMQQEIISARNVTTAAKSCPWTQRTNLPVFLDGSQSEWKIVAQTIITVFSVVLSWRGRQWTQKSWHLHPNTTVQVFVLDTFMEWDQQRDAKQRRFSFVVRQEIRVLTRELPVNGDQIITLTIIVDASFVLTRWWNRNVVVIVIDVATVCASVELRMVHWRWACRQVIGRWWQQICSWNCLHVVRSSRGVHKRTHWTCSHHVDRVLEWNEKKLFLCNFRKLNSIDIFHIQSLWICLQLAIEANVKQNNTKSFLQKYEKSKIKLQKCAKIFLWLILVKKSLNSAKLPLKSKKKLCLNLEQRQ